MEEYYVYHVVTERPMFLGQKIKFDENNCSGVYRRVMEKKDLVEEIYSNPQKYESVDLEHHTKVALRELALEKIRLEKYPNYPSRLASLYVSSKLEGAKNWAEYFISLGREVFQIVKLKVIGNKFTGDAHNCFDGTINEEINISLARNYWENGDNFKGLSPSFETIVDGDIEVVEIIKDYTKEVKEL